MKVSLKKTWTIDRTFSYDIPDSDVKKAFKTLKTFQTQIKSGTDKALKFISDYNPENVEDVESEPSFLLSKNT